MPAPTPHLLFSYGTLQAEQVQRDRFGRLLDGAPDALPGYRMTEIRITDPAVIASSGTDVHPLVVPSRDRADAVPGVVFRITGAELASADEYESENYARSEVELASGARAWVYLDARPGE